MRVDLYVRETRMDDSCDERVARNGNERAKRGSAPTEARCNSLPQPVIVLRRWHSSKKPQHKAI